MGRSAMVTIGANHDCVGSDGRPDMADQHIK